MTPLLRAEFLFRCSSGRWLICDMCRRLNLDCTLFAPAARYIAVHIEQRPRLGLAPARPYPLSHAVPHCYYSPSSVLSGMSNVPPITASMLTSCFSSDFIWTLWCYPNIYTPMTHSTAIDRMVRPSLCTMIRIAYTSRTTHLAIFQRPDAWRIKLQNSES